MLSVLVGGCNQIPSTAHHKSAALHLIRKVIVFHATEFLRLVTSSFGHMAPGRAKPSAVLCSSAVQSRFDLAALVLLFRSFYENRKFLFFFFWCEQDLTPASARFPSEEADCLFVFESHRQTHLFSRYIVGGDDAFREFTVRSSLPCLYRGSILSQ